MPAYVMTIRVELASWEAAPFFDAMVDLAFQEAGNDNVDCSFGPATADDVALLPHPLKAA